jgi:hypothetical protein
MPDTPLDIEPIKARHAAAVPGPYFTPAAIRLNRVKDFTSQPIAKTGRGEYDWVLTDHIGDVERFTPRTTNFLAASWQDVANLIAEVERLRAENAAFARLERWFRESPTTRYCRMADVNDYGFAVHVMDDAESKYSHFGCCKPTIAAAINAALDAAGAER